MRDIIWEHIPSTKFEVVFHKKIYEDKYSGLFPFKKEKFFCFKRLFWYLSGCMGSGLSRTMTWDENTDKRAK